MRKKPLKYSLLFLAVAIMAFLFIREQKSHTIQAWGFFGHKQINRYAVFTLPSELIGFYKNHLEFVTAHAVDPDKRRYAFEEEAPRHYIDIDHYGENPFDVMPIYWNDAVEKFSEDTLMAYGIVPWYIPVMMSKLTRAFKEKNQELILKYSSDLGHYIADAHVPLHTTENYNGQLTGQKGIHGFWESRLPELKSVDYTFWVGKANYVSNVQTACWDIVKESHYAVDSVLAFEKKLSDEVSPDLKYSFERRGNQTFRVYSKEYSEKYHQMLGGMVERKMKKAVFMVGSLWYTAWVDAGQPTLENLSEDVSPEFAKELEQLNNAFGEGKIKGRDHDN